MIPGYSIEIKWKLDRPEMLLDHFKSCNINDPNFRSSKPVNLVVYNYAKNVFLEIDTDSKYHNFYELKTKEFSPTACGGDKISQKLSQSPILTFQKPLDFVRLKGHLKYNKISNVTRHKFRIFETNLTLEIEIENNKATLTVRFTNSDEFKTAHSILEKFVDI